MVYSIGVSLVWLFVMALASSRAQSPINPGADDRKRIESLEKEGAHLEGTHVTLWYPPSLPRADAEAIMKRLDPAVDALRKRVGAHDWQAVARGKITYYLHDDTFVGHANMKLGGAVFLPMVRVKYGRAPFLHEATHVLLYSTKGIMALTGSPKDAPVWLVEGMADYIARLVADQLRITEEGPFGPPTLSSADALCAERARTSNGAKMLPFVGSIGLPDMLLTTDRSKFAPTFYSCSLSFTKYLAEKIGTEPLINLFGFPEGEVVARLEGMAGRPLAQLVADWRRAVSDYH